MEIKHIDKLRELNKFIWGDNKLESIYSNDEIGTELELKRNMIHSSGNSEFIKLFEVSEKNLSELEFYGLKVVLNEKPKLTRKERDFLECLDSEDIHLAREESKTLVAWSVEPNQRKDFGYWTAVDDDYRTLDLAYETFNFITWESGKAWSKAELMELEVVE